MNILIDICHPAHVHLFKNTINFLKLNNYNVIITVKDVPSAVYLLKKYDIKFIHLGDKSDSIVGKFKNQFYYNYKIFKIVTQSKIDLMLGSSITITQVSAITGIPSILFDDDDDDVQPLMTILGHPFATWILSPNVLYRKRARKNVVYYSSYHELAYLHPNQFKPDTAVASKIGVNHNESYFLLRFNSFNAHHDMGEGGLSIETKRAIIKKLEPHGKIFITTEGQIDDEFEKYRIKIEPENIHSIIYFATMLIGDSQTMTSEAAVLGTPSIRCNTFVNRISYLDEEEHIYRLTYGFHPYEQEKIIDKIQEWLDTPNLKATWDIKRKAMLMNKVDSTELYISLIKYIEKYGVMNLHKMPDITY